MHIQKDFQHHRPRSFLIYSILFSTIACQWHPCFLPHEDSTIPHPIVMIVKTAYRQQQMCPRTKSCTWWVSEVTISWMNWIEISMWLTVTGLNFFILFNWTYFQHLLNITKHFCMFWQNWLHNWKISFNWSLGEFWAKQKKKINLFSAHPKSTSRIKLKCHSEKRWTLTLEASACGNWASLCRTKLSVPQVPTLQGRDDKGSHLIGQ